MSLEAIEQKAKSVLEAYYELERLKIKNAPRAELEKQKTFILSLTSGMKKELEAEKE